MREKVLQEFGEHQTSKHAHGTACVYVSKARRILQETSPFSLMKPAFTALTMEPH